MRNSPSESEELVGEIRPLRRIEALDSPGQPAIEASEKRYRRLFESARDGILVLDGDTGKIVDVNPRLTELTGYSRDHFLGKHFWEVAPFETLAAFRESFAKLQTEKAILYTDLPIEAHDGRPIDVEFVTNIYRVDDRDIVQCTLRDITERKLSEATRARLFLQDQKLEGIGRLAGGVAHEFNNLLSVILSYSGFAVDALREGEPLRDDLLEVKKAAEHAALLTRELLAFGQKQKREPVSVDLNQLLAKLETMLRGIVGEDIALAQTLAPDLGLVEVDPSQLEEVIVNLAVNARDAMPGGGRLTIETANAELDAECSAGHGLTPGSYVRFAVTDWGVGMDAQTLARLFEPFFTTKQLGRGTGFGLATVYGIVKQSGGSISVASELDTGTTFEIYLPRSLSRRTTFTQSELPSAVTGTETVLVVDDEDALRRVAGRILEAAGYTVLTAVNADDALQASARHEGDIDLLLTDVVMPGINGRALARELEQTRPTCKVVYMSGYTEHGVLDEGAHFLGKPFSTASLTQKIRQVLDSPPSALLRICPVSVR